MNEEAQSKEQQGSATGRSTWARRGRNIITTVKPKCHNGRSRGNGSSGRRVVNVYPTTTPRHRRQDRVMTNIPTRDQTVTVARGMANRRVRVTNVSTGVRAAAGMTSLREIVTGTAIEIATESATEIVTVIAIVIVTEKSCWGSRGRPRTWTFRQAIPRPPRNLSLLMLMIHCLKGLSF